MGAARSFGGGEADFTKKREARALALGARQAPTFESFSPEHAEVLLGVAQGVFGRGGDLLAFADHHRDQARMAGVETIAVELAGILDGERLERVLDALENAALNGTKVQVSVEGLQLLRRAERLLAEAASNLRKYAEREALELTRLEEDAKRSEQLSQARIALEERRLSLMKDENRFREEAIGIHLEGRKASLGVARQSIGDYEPVLPSEWDRPYRVDVAQAPPEEPEQPIWPWIVIGVLGFTTAMLAVLVPALSEIRERSGRKRERP